MKYTIFGESHGPAIGVVLEGVPAGLELNAEEIQRQLDRRAPGKSELSTARKESDLVHIISGFFEGKTTGAPLTMVIQNSDQHSGDYESIRYTPRPGHADYAGFMASKGALDYRGGGHFSGRLTAPLVAAGAVARQVLAQQGVWVGAHISTIYGILDRTMETPEELKPLADKPFPVLDEGKGEEMRQAILEAKENGDSVGGSIECVVAGLPAGFGAPDFGRNVEGIFSQYLFAVPALPICWAPRPTTPLWWRGAKWSPKPTTPGASTAALPTGCPLSLRSLCGPPPPSLCPRRVWTSVPGRSWKSRSRAATTPASSPGRWH